ncbi:hypothetical protein [Fischerella thermalis]|uniref:hypothetical protein n=1 Tax=Fischerella thermalis TaxID=372787 RepID=UPI0015E12EA8|nr:hypothetical protein [Fischerella thermalis]MBF1991399.1 hypothetical protein [Fischerella thermalis M58_A2018_009]
MNKRVWYKNHFLRNRPPIHTHGTQMTQMDFLCVYPCSSHLYTLREADERV